MADKFDRFKRFTKDELIYGIRYACDEYSASRIASVIERKRIDEDYEKEQRLLRESNEAMNAYCSCMREICEKYGDGKTVNLAKVPLPEIERAAAFETEWKTKEQKWRKVIGIK